MLLSRTAIFQLDNFGYTPLRYAVGEGEETSVAFLLAAGASDKNIWWQKQTPSLWLAVENGHERIVRILVAAGVDVIGGSTAMLGAMTRASGKGHARILGMLFRVEGEARQKRWARQMAGNVPILHHAIMYGSLATVHVCLAAGADERFVTPTGVRADRVIRPAPPSANKPVELRAAIGRMLRRGPAFRARSWAWPVTVDADGIGGAPAESKKNSATLTVGADGVGAPSTEPLKPSGTLTTSVRVFRPRDDRLLSTRFAR